MKSPLIVGILVATYLHTCIPQRLQNNVPAANRQGGVGGISFAIPGLSLLGGNNGVGGNLFGVATFTRTVVSTVSTVTTASYRTCIMLGQGLMPCGAAPAGRRKREAGDEENNAGPPESKIEATPVVQVIIGSTTIKDPVEASEYLEAHKGSSQSVIFPPVEKADTPIKISPRLEPKEEVTTILYPSQDTPESLEIVQDSDDVITGTTEIPDIQDEIPELNDDVIVDKARVGLGRTTTVTTVIRVTSVATSLATGGASATVSVVYMGCSPQSLPFTGPTCVT